MSSILLYCVVCGGSQTDQNIVIAQQIAILVTNHIRFNPGYTGVPSLPKIEKVHSVR